MARGKCFLQAVQRFTISPWLPEHSYITANMWKKKRTYEKKKRQEAEKKEGKDRREGVKRGGGKESRWCHAFHSKRWGSSQQGKHTNITRFFKLLVRARCRGAERQPQCRPRISADVANWPYLASQGRKKEGRRRRGPKFHIRFLSNKADVESAAAFKLRPASYKSWVTISGGDQPFWGLRSFFQVNKDTFLASELYSELIVQIVKK